MTATTEVIVQVAEEIGAGRTAEALRFMVPVPPDQTWDPARLRVRRVEDDRSVPHQVTSTRRGRDGRVTAVGLVCLLSLPGSARCRLAVGPSDEPPPSVENAVRIETDDDRIRLHNGILDVRVDLDRFSLTGAGVLASSLVLVSADGAESPARVRTRRVLQEGPVLGEVLLEGVHDVRGGAPEWEFAARLLMRAGSAELDVEAQIIAVGEASASEARAWSLRLDTGEVARVSVGAFDNVHEAAPPVRIFHRGRSHARGIFAVSEIDGGQDWRFTGDPAYLDRWEWAELEGRHATNWIAVAARGGPLTVAAAQFTENFPGDLVATPEGVAAMFWPDDGEPLVLTQGAAKTRSVRLVPAVDAQAGLRANTPLAVVHAFADATLPSVAAAPLAYAPEAYPNLEAHIREELFGWYQSGQSLGFYDFGDSMQGISAGPRTGYSANNEHDALYALLLHYLRSGERAYLDSAVAYGDHVRDMDLVHHSTVFPGEIGGLRAHGRHHVHYVSARTIDGPVRTSIDTGHTWTEGLVLLSEVTGDDRYLETAVRVADGLLGLHELGWTRPEPAPRNSGWPLIALSAVAHATGDERYLDVAAQIACLAMEAQGTDGRWTNRIGLADDYCAWQNAVLLIGLDRLHGLNGDGAVAASVRRGLDALLELGRNPDGTFVYMTRFDYRWANRAGLVREALAIGYARTADERFLDAGLAGGSRWYRPRGAAPALSNDIAEWRGHLPFLAQAHAAGRLKDLEG